MTYLVLQNFHVFAASDDPDKDGPKVAYKRGMTVQASEIPRGHSAEGWIERGLMRDTSAPGAPAEHDET